MEPGETRRNALTRRRLLAGAGAGAATIVVAACSSGSGDGAAPAASSTPSKGASTGASGGGTGGGAGGGSGLVAVSDVPVGGAVSATGTDEKPLIVAQPTKGDIVAFSAICTHQGCTVAPKGGQLVCPCHGSTYDLATGKNTGGPAPSPLPGVAVSVEDGQVVEG